MGNNEMTNYDSKEYKRSRCAYIGQATFQYFVRLLVADAFLAKLLMHIGISDSLIGIISSFISLAFIIQLMTIFVVKMKVGTKKLVTVFETVSIFFFMLLYLIPFLPITKAQKTIVIIASIVIAYGASYLVSSICFKWTSSYVDPRKRGTYCSTMEIISLISGIVFTAIIGFIIDRYEAIGDLEGSFLFIAAAILILNILSFASFMMIKKEDKARQLEENRPLKEVMKNTFGKKEFNYILIIAVLWQMAVYFTVGFMGTFKTKELGLSLLSIQIINMAGNLMRMALSRPLGKFSDKYSFSKGFRVGLYLLALAFLINIFTTNETRFLIVLFTILYNCSFAGTNQNSSNVIFSYVDSAYIVQAMALKSCISGFCGFGASILAGIVLEWVQNNGNKVLGIPMYGQQFLSIISLGLTIAAIIFSQKVVEKQKIKIQ